MSYRSLFLFRESCIATVFWGYFRVTILVSMSLRDSINSRNDCPLLFWGKFP